MYNPLIVPSHTVEIPSAIAVGDDTKALAASARYDTALNSADNKAKITITFESNAPSKSTSVNQKMSNIGSGKDESNLVATLVMTSAEGTRVMSSPWVERVNPSKPSVKSVSGKSKGLRKRERNGQHQRRRRRRRRRREMLKVKLVKGIKKFGVRITRKCGRIKKISQHHHHN